MALYPRRYHVEYLDVDGKIILKWTLREKDGRMWLGIIWLRQDPVAGFCEHGNEI
jgi:hypothetical protein